MQLLLDDFSQTVLEISFKGILIQRTPFYQRDNGSSLDLKLHSLSLRLIVLNQLIPERPVCAFKIEIAA